MEGIEWTEDTCTVIPTIWANWKGDFAGIINTPGQLNGLQSKVHPAAKGGRYDQFEGLFLQYSNNSRLGHCLVAVVQ